MDTIGGLVVCQICRTADNVLRYSFGGRNIWLCTNCEQRADHFGLSGAITLSLQDEVRGLRSQLVGLRLNNL